MSMTVSITLNRLVPVTGFHTLKVVAVCIAAENSGTGSGTGPAVKSLTGVRSISAVGDWGANPAVAVLSYDDSVLSCDHVS